MTERIVVIAANRPEAGRFLRRQPHLNPRDVTLLTLTAGRRARGMLGPEVVLVYTAGCAKAARAHAVDLAMLVDKGARQVAG